MEAKNSVKNFFLYGKNSWSSYNGKDLWYIYFIFILYIEKSIII